MKKTLLSHMTYKCFNIIKYTYTHIIRNPCWNKVKRMFKLTVSRVQRKWQATARVLPHCRSDLASPPLTPQGSECFLSRMGSEGRMPGFKSHLHHLPASCPGQVSSPLCASVSPFITRSAVDIQFFGFCFFLASPDSSYSFFYCPYSLAIATKLMPALEKNHKTQ